MKSKRTFVALALGLLWSVSACGPNTLSDPRANATATLLPDGEVLVAGGQSGEEFQLPWRVRPRVLASAERYDPESGMWRPTGAMRVGRHGHTATGLPSGKVLVAGGSSYNPGSNYLDSTPMAELYDPESGTWSPTGPMTRGRTGHQATLLEDGRVLVTGGGEFSPTDTAEVYDPAKGVWFPVASMRSSRGLHAATLLRDGRVLVSGGVGPSSSHLHHAEVYDPVANTWSSTGSTHTWRVNHALTPLPDGKVLVTGSIYAELYDPATGTWTDAGNWMDFFATSHTATLLPDGRVLVVGGGGGEGSDNGALDNTALYDPKTHSWTPTTFLPERRTGHSAVLLRDGRVLVVGGHTLDKHRLYLPLNTSVTFDPGTSTWR